MSATVPSPCAAPRRSRRGLALLVALAIVLAAGAWGERHLWAWRHFRAGRAALDDRARAREALDHLAACRTVWDADPCVRLLLARAARLAGDSVAAEEHLDACWRLAGTTEEWVLERTLLRAQNEGLDGDAEAYLLARLTSDDATALAVLDALTSAYLRAHRLTEARERLDDWLRRRPREPEALVRRAWVAEHLFLFPEALADYEAVLDLEPARWPVRLRLAEILLQTERTPDALPHLERLGIDHPDDPAVRLALARCHAHLGDEDKARQLLDGLIAAGDAGAAVLCERGKLALVSGRDEEAEVWLRRAAERASHDRETVYQLRLCLERLGKDAEARACASRLERIDSDLKRMRPLMQQVLAAPHDVASRCEVGEIFLRNDLTDDGVRWLGTALAEDPTCPRAHAALADHFERSGDDERCAFHRRQAGR
jgi:tetratricopeptide (TPR) repeat protein